MGTHWNNQEGPDKEDPGGDEGTPQTPEPPKPASTASTLGGCFLILLAPLLLFGACGIIVSLTSDDEERNDRESSYYAETACKRSVERQLKAPSTADFTVVSATKESSREWTVTGTVDAENSFGAKIRNNWICTATKSGDSWTGDALVY